jgi:signal transduction histidine kinase
MRLSREKAATEALREVEALRELTRLKDQFLNQVSHELRSPLTVIHGFAEMLASGWVAPEEVTNIAGEVHRSSAVMLRLVDDLLDLSRMESGRLDLRRAATDLAPWLRQAATAYGMAVATHRVEVDVPESLPPVAADIDRLEQVLHNLLSNAHRYSPEGGTICVSAVVDGSCLEIAVRDDGVGVPEEDRARIFEKFYRGQNGPTLAARGAGIGLAVARTLVEAHGGGIGVDSPSEGGSIFWVRLPIESSRAEVGDGTPRDLLET